MPKNPTYKQHPRTARSVATIPSTFPAVTSPFSLGSIMPISMSFSELFPMIQAIGPSIKGQTTRESIPSTRINVPLELFGYE